MYLLCNILKNKQFFRQSTKHLQEPREWDAQILQWIVASEKGDTLPTL